MISMPMASPYYYYCFPETGRPASRRMNLQSPVMADMDMSMNMNMGINMNMGMGMNTLPMAAAPAMG